MKDKNFHLPYSKKVCIKDSSIHGKGVFAKKDLKRGEIIFIIKGKKRVWHVKNEKQALYGGHWVGLGKSVWVDTIGYGKYLNHSLNPSCGIKGRVTVCARYNIKKGEEITIDYSITEEDTLWWMTDFSSGKVIKSIQSLPLKKFKKYLPYIPRYFQKVYNNFHHTRKHG